MKEEEYYNLKNELLNYFKQEIKKVKIKKSELEFVDTNSIKDIELKRKLIQIGFPMRVFYRILQINKELLKLKEKKPLERPSYENSSECLWNYIDEAISRLDYTFHLSNEQKEYLKNVKYKKILRTSIYSNGENYTARCSRSNNTIEVKDLLPKELIHEMIHLLNYNLTDGLVEYLAQIAYQSDLIFTKGDIDSRSIDVDTFRRRLERINKGFSLENNNTISYYPLVYGIFQLSSELKSIGYKNLLEGVLHSKKNIEEETIEAFKNKDNKGLVELFWIKSKELEYEYYRFAEGKCSQKCVEDDYLSSLISGISERENNGKSIR